MSFEAITAISEAEENAKRMKAEALAAAKAAEAAAQQYLENIQRISSQQDAISRVIKEQSAKEAAQIRQEAEAYSQKVHADADAYWKQVAARASKLLADQEALRQLIQSAGEVEINEEHSKSVP